MLVSVNALGLTPPVAVAPKSQVAGDAVGDRPGAEVGHVPEAGVADHGLGRRRPVTALRPGGRVAAAHHPPALLAQHPHHRVATPGPRPEVHVPPLLVQEQLAGQAAEEQLDVAVGRGGRVAGHRPTLSDPRGRL